MISELSSVFEILTGLNLAYAGSETFRNVVDNSVLRIKDTVSRRQKEQIEIIRSEIFVSNSDISTQNHLLNRTSVQERYFDKNIKLVLENEKMNSEFPKGIKSIFLIDCLFCFFLLILGGYENISENLKIEIFQLVSFLILFLSFINICLFIRNLYPEKISSNINPLTAIIFFLIPIFLFYVINYFKPSTFFSLQPEILGIISIFLGLSAFILHIFRALIHKTYFRFHLIRIRHRTENELREFQRSLHILNGKKGNKKANKNRKSGTFIQINSNNKYFYIVSCFIKALSKDGGKIE